MWKGFGWALDQPEALPRRATIIADLGHWPKIYYLCAMAEDNNTEQSSAGGIVSLVLGLLIIAGSYVFSFVYDNAWIAVIGIAIGCISFSITGKNKDNPEKTSGGGISFYIFLMTLWLLAYIIINL